MSRRFTAAAMLTLAALVGCDGSADAPPSGTDAAPTANRSSGGNGNGSRNASATAPATSPATTQAAESLINIDGNLVLFPAAKLRIDESDDKVVARLFSDDPKGAALDENYDGNSFYLQIDLDDGVNGGVDGAVDGGANGGVNGRDAKDLDGVVLSYRARTSERDDTPYGIFLEGRRWVLQPDNVKVAFEGSTSPLHVQIDGTFLMFDTTDETAKPRRARVAAKLVATVQPRK